MFIELEVVQSIWKVFESVKAFNTCSMLSLLLLEGVVIYLQVNSDIE